ncbi:hypothetical protein MNB_SV-4-1389 [hydrothermal vent metagenome]|uniref:Uncharacterized protein n=1 Tax=hydrothermal vent metagenome TaxID=652676 RepID=A0A1W1E9M9_9ZZZZ
MDRCKEIVANVRMEECYEGMSLVFEGSRDDLRAEINAAIEKACSQTGLKPLVFDNKKTDKVGHEAFYIEFTDEAQRESGAFFECVLKELGIDKCENDVIEG